MFVSIKTIAKKWKISERRIRVLCQEGKIPSAYKDGKTWKILETEIKPVDSRFKNSKSIYKQIKELKAKLDKKRPFTSAELRVLNEEFILQNTYNSNAIEGNTLTLRETELVLRGLTIGKKPLKDHLEIIGYKEAFDFVLNLVKEKSPLTVETIKQIHFLVLASDQNDRGVFRKIPVKILGAKHETVNPFLIQEKLEAVISKYRNNQENIVKKVALFHIDFEVVHPFIDGNGTCGRLLVNFELMKAGLPPIDIKFTDREKYYNAFDKYHEKGDLSAMEKLFAGYILKRLKYLLEILG